MVAARSRSCRADFNISASSGEDEAAGALSWYLLRRWGRLAVLRGLHVREVAFQHVAGSRQARERQHRDASGFNGVGDEYWYQRGSRTLVSRSWASVRALVCTGPAVVMIEPVPDWAEPVSDSHACWLSEI